MVLWPDLQPPAGTDATSTSSTSGGWCIRCRCATSPPAGGREVYLEHYRETGAAQDTLQLIRMQKWGVREHLDEGKDLLQAMIECEEYTAFIMDRRLGCRQLGMNIAAAHVRCAEWPNAITATRRRCTGP